MTPSTPRVPVVSEVATPTTPHSPELLVENPLDESIKKASIPTAKSSFELFRKQALERVIYIYYT